MEKIVVEIDEDLAALIPRFLANKEKDILSMREELLKENFTAIKITGHSMKGSGGGYGFDEISQIGADIENRAESGNAGEVANLVDKLEAYLSAIEIKYC